MDTPQQRKETLAAANREFWNDHGHEIFKQQWVLNMAKRIGDVLSDSVQWMNIRSQSDDGPPVKLLDYACGYGLVSSSLLGQFDIIRGIDISESSVASYNEMARQTGVPIEQMFAIQGTIPPPSTNTVLATDEFFDFDLIAISMALHHIDDPVGVLSGLYERLRSGGVLVVVDLAPETYPQQHASHNSNYHLQSHENEPSNSHTRSQHTIAKHGGFGPEEIQILLSKAGFTSRSFDYQFYPEMGPTVSDTPEHDTCKVTSLKPFFIAKSAKN
ncbi:methyltransferase type 11 [Trichoderma arundinaceum]|uniref:Methyltransferase type 11 n=1 Tax=Trichoderma arundinaceum TaxID=490622 RepID=A0A395P1G2_TRIAR|nr:methyltransferase type 11 [Trichoderma arundinaceum]